jgi:hypothetical protein
MPTVNGQMYAEAHGLGRFDELNVLILGSLDGELTAFAIKVDTLHTYLTDTLGSNVRLKLHCTNVVAENTARLLRITRHDIGELTTGNLQSVTKELDIDVVFDQNNLFNKRYTQEHFYEFQIVGSLSGLASSCEDFLIGHSIVWLFSDISWNTSMFMRYFGRRGVCSDYFAFMGECTTKGYSNEQQDKVRYIANRLSHVEYSKDIIQYHLKRMRKAERNGHPDTGNLELNYHLGNYYFLMAGIMDSMARLINNIYKLGFIHPRDLALEKSQFIEANRRKRTGFVRIITNRAFVNWLSFLKERRNFIAHDGDMRQSPLVEQKDTLLTDAEVEELVNQKMDWAYAASFLPTESIRAMREQAAQMIRIERDYRVIAKNVMIVPDLRTGGTKIYQPLRSIEYDYDRLRNVMELLLERLKR